MTKSSSILPPFLGDVLNGLSPRASIHKAGVGTRAVLARQIVDSGASVVLLARDEAEYRALKGALAVFLSPDSLVDFPPLTGRKNHRHGQWPARMAALHGLAARECPCCVLLTLDNLRAWWPPVSLFDSNHITLTRGEDMSPDLILEQATMWGYERVSMVTSPGEMSMRGDILDIFTPGFDMPVRLEFFGDTLEDMRLFDAMSQRSRGDLDEAELIPSRPAIPSPEYLQGAERKLAGMLEQSIIDEDEHMDLRARLESVTDPLPPSLFFEHPARFDEWLPPGAVYLGPAVEDIRATLVEQGGQEEEDVVDSESGPLLSLDGALGCLDNKRLIEFRDLVMGVGVQGQDMPERVISSHEELMLDREINHDSEESASRKDFQQRPWQSLVARLKEWTRTRRQCILCFHTAGGRKKFLKLAEQDGIKPWTEYSPLNRGLFALVAPFQRGLSLNWCQTLVLGENLLQPGGSRSPVRERSFKGLSRYDDLEPGDPLVHRDYGLGRFLGLVKMDVGEVSNDFMLLEYAAEDKLYVPVDRMGLVQRYKSTDDTVPPADKLGGIAWIRSREKARKAVERIARELVEMYAYRKVAKGYSYGPMGDMYREFEVSFGFEETPDQARAIREVLDDMEKPEPMDRLVCGDVGFGKTEVAMRAAFRAAMEGRQVALLCPTTVLAEQHYQNFKSRMQPFPLNVGMLSRFVPPARQKKVVQAASRGGIDILIGTHRMLSKDIVLPNLGLLILDEEQRFGVKHKERLKEFRKNVDVLTLTATPIPRTLQLSLSGIRGLSVIETPPLERKPVHSMLMERDQGALAAVVRRELEREGQVFWVYNRVRGLAQVRDYVSKLAPEARVDMAHGQMSERALEDAMHAFWRHETDVLVCTSIIESGLDFPRANTIVVDQAHHFGLGQLYQLKGRVGRSDRQAYAYFILPNVEHCPENARKRLKVLMDMDYLGAGYQVAMEDLRLRGAGNILGESQSGHITKLGLDLFLEMLENEVSRIKGEPLRERSETELNIGFTANIPESYVDDPRQRLSYYKELTTATDPEARRDVVLEIRDRFGPLPDELKRFVRVLEFKSLLGDLQVARADLFPGLVRLHWEENASAVSPEHLIRWVGEREEKARLLPPATLELRLDENKAIRERLGEAAVELSLLKETTA